MYNNETMPLVQMDRVSERERRKNGDSTNPSRVDEFTDEESKGGSLQRTEQAQERDTVGPRGHRSRASTTGWATLPCLPPALQHHEPGLGELAGQRPTGLWT